MLAFNKDILEQLIPLRTDALTGFFQVFTFLGEVEGYVLLITLIYTVFNKKFAVKLAIVGLISMSINHFLKILIANPRPFLADGTHMEKWAVSSQMAQTLSLQFSTPSGHAMSAAAFFGYLSLSVKKRSVQVMCVLTIIFIGLSRPYLAVHYVEDIILGWILGIAIALIAIANAQSIQKIWHQISYRGQVMSALCASTLFWLLTSFLNGTEVSAHPLPFVGHIGFLTGLVIAVPLERKHVDFNAKSSGIIAKTARWLITITFVMIPIILIGVFTKDTEASALLHLIHYLGYVTTGVAGIFAAPWTFCKLGLAQKETLSKV